MRGHIRVRKGSRGTSYELRVYAGIDENGRRRYIVETVRGSRRDAEKRLAQLITAADSGQAGPTSKVRLSELVDAWWEACTSHLSPHTRIGYRGMYFGELMTNRQVLLRVAARCCGTNHQQDRQPPLHATSLRLLRAPSPWRDRELLVR